MAAPEDPAALRRALDAALAREAALAEVLGVINASPGDPQPVFDVITRLALKLCGSTAGALMTYDGALMHVGRVIAADMPEAALTAHFSQFPRAPGRVLVIERALLDGVTIYSHDIRAEPGMQQTGIDLGHRATLAVPLMRDGRAIGVLSLTHKEVGGFSAAHVALVESFAAQAVVAMENARLLGDLKARDAENSALIARQAASIEVLKSISASPENAQPVFDIITRRAMELCRSTMGALFEYDGALVHIRTFIGTSRSAAEEHQRAFPRPLSDDFIVLRSIRTRKTINISDIRDEAGVVVTARSVGERSLLVVPLLRDGRAIGAFSIAHEDAGAFTDAHATLLETFAEQAVIAINSANALREVRARTDDLQEALEYQTATSDVLKVISRSAFDLSPVLQTVVATAVRLCVADSGTVYLREGDTLLVGANASVLQAWEKFASAHGAFVVPSNPVTATQRAFRERTIMHFEDIEAIAGYPERARLSGQRTTLAVPLLRDGEVVGIITVERRHVERFTDRQVDLVSTFADQAVIAIENTRLLSEQQEALERQTATAEVLAVINASPGDLAPVFATILAKAHALCGADSGSLGLFDGANFRKVARHGYGMEADDALSRPYPPMVEHAPLLRGETIHVPDVLAHPWERPAAREFMERTGLRTWLEVPLFMEGRLLGTVSGWRRAPRAFQANEVALLESFAAQAVIAMENARLLGALRAALDQAEEARRGVEAAYRELKIAQANLVQSEKMASLGQLTAGIAHEIKNPLNFVNNFSALSAELVDELREVLGPAGLPEAIRVEVDDLADLLKGNLEKVVHHGKRADGIVRSMLEHSRGTSGERWAVDLNAEVEEALNLAYHGARAQDPSFNITLERDYAEAIAPIVLTPQDITRVFLNLFNNGFYAAKKGAGDAPMLKVSTRDLGDAVEIRVRDNGTGIPPDIREKLFQPFFTTKPTGEGTGLGLSITYDIVTKQHGGTIAVESEVGAYSEFIVTLPREARG